MEILWLLLIVYSIVSFGNSSCCVQFLNDKCVECPQGMHLFRDNCIFDVENCHSYKDGFECEQCREGFTLQSQKCSQLPSSPKESSNLSPTRQSPNNSEEKNPQQYKVIEIDFKNLHLIKDIDLVDEFQISDDILRKNYAKEVKKAQIIKAQQRTYHNGTIHIAIEYKNDRHEVYYGTTMVNLDTFIFQVIQFKLFDPLDVRNEQKQNNSTQQVKKQEAPPIQLPYTLSFSPYNLSFSFPPLQFTQNEIDLVNYTQLQIMNTLDLEGMNYLKEQTDKQPGKRITKNNKETKEQLIVVEVTQMQSADVRVYNNDKERKEYIVLNYLTNDEELRYTIVGEIKSTQNKSDLKEIGLVYAGFDRDKLKITQAKHIHSNNQSSQKSTPQNPIQQSTTDLLDQPTQSYQSQKNSFTQMSHQANSSSEIKSFIDKMHFLQVKDEMQLLNDIYFMIAKDQVNRQLKEYADGVPQRVYVARLKGAAEDSVNRLVDKLKNHNFYKIVYVLGNLTAEVVVSCNLATFVPKIQLVISNQSSQDPVPVSQSDKHTNGQKNPNPPSSNISNRANTTSPSFRNKSSISIPSGFVPCDSSIINNVYYLIAMETLTNIEKKYLNLKPLQTYLKNQTGSNIISFLFTFQIKNQSQQLWLTIVDVFLTSFKAQIAKNQLVSTIELPPTLKQQSQNNQSLQKDQPNTTSPILQPLKEGKTVLLRMRGQRILLSTQYSQKRNLRSTLSAQAD